MWIRVDSKAGIHDWIRRAEVCETICEIVSSKLPICKQTLADIRQDTRCPRYGREVFSYSYDNHYRFKLNSAATNAISLGLVYFDLNIN